MKSRRPKKGSSSLAENIVAKLLGLTLGVIGFAVLYWAPVSSLTCRHIETNQVDCLLKQRLLGLIPVGETPITRLERAYIGRDTQTSRRSSDNRGYTYPVAKVILVSAAGEISLNDWGDPAITVGDPDRIARQINDYLASPPTEETLTVWQALWLPLLAGSCFDSFLVLWVVGLLITGGTWLKRSWSERGSKQDQ